PRERAAPGRAALPRHRRAPHPVGGRGGRFRRRLAVHGDGERRPGRRADRGVRAGALVLAQDAPRALRGRGARGGRGGALAPGPRPGHAGGRDRARRAGERGVRRVRAEGRGVVRDDPRVRGVHRRRAGGRGGGDGVGVLRRAQGPPGPQRRHRAGQRVADRAVRGAGARVAELRHRAPMTLQFWPGAVVMMLIATMTASLVTNSGRSAWFVGALVVMVYLIFAMTLYVLPPRSQ